MISDSPFYSRAELMLRMIPFVGREECFALKGGSAINFFVRDLPRLSVDIDLTYLPVEARDVSLEKIDQALGRIAAAIRKTHKNLRVQEGTSGGGRQIRKLFVSDGRQQIKIEPNEVLRGAVFGSEERTVTSRVEETFGMSATMRILSFPDLYGGKLCAMLDRQHPRDMFDVKLLLENEEITPEVRRAFVVYLAGHDRPIHELIDSKPRDMRKVYEAEFQGMATERVTFEDLIRAREAATAVLKSELSKAEKQFLVSLKEMNPKWALLGIEGLERLPAIQWKLANLKKMGAEKRKTQLRKLKALLDVV